MDRRALERITTTIAFCAAIAVTASYAFGGLRFGTGALVGAVVALLNWASMRWILRRVHAGAARTQAVLMTLLVGKMGLLAATVWVVVGLFRADAGGFALGLGALVVGLTLGGLASATPDLPIDDAGKEH